jgi:PTS system nitrogen regulatory IIA component
VEISDIIETKRIACNADVTSKKRVLELMSELMGHDQNDAPASAIFDSLFERERLGSTGLGNGIAIPHGRIKQSKRPIGAFALIHDGVDFDAPDNQPVDLVFGLVVPEESTAEHLQILAQLATRLNNPVVCEQLRRCHSSSELLAVLTEAPPAQVAS